MKISIVIPTYNRPDLLTACLNKLNESIVKFTAGEWEIIVTDDSKTSETRELIENKFNWVKWVAGPQKGPASNRNNGARHTSGEWLFFMDDDCLPDKNILTEYYNAAIINQDIRVFEGRITVDTPQQSFLEESPVNETGGFLWSCNFMINKNIFEKELTGFDERFPFAAMEDVDLHYRITKLGYPIVFVPNAVVVHPWRVQKNLFSKTINGFKSALYFREKYPEIKEEINSLSCFMSFGRFLIKGTLGNVIRFRGRGLYQKLSHDFLQLYFAAYLFVKDNFSRKSQQPL